MSTALPLRRVLNDATQITQRPMRDFTVLSASRDPYRLDTPAGHKKGRWLADALKEVNPEGRRLHPRGLHYRLVGRVLLPDDPPALVGETDVQAEPLYDSEADWSAATLRLIERKRYGEDDMEEAA